MGERRRTTQLIFPHEPDKGRWGDCHRTAIAYVLGYRPEDVPHFIDNDADDHWQHMCWWLGRRGIIPINVAYMGSETLDSVMVSVAGNNRDTPPFHYLMGGRSPRGSDHTVVCCGDRVVFDPSPYGGNLEGPMSTGYWIATFFGHTKAI
jgi:hypothetical protein